MFLCLICCYRLDHVDLSDYAGKTVNVIVAAVPASEPDSFCLLYRFKDVAVGEQ